MAALTARTAASRSTFVDGRDENVASMDSNAARFFEVDAYGEAGEVAEVEVDACVCVDGAVADPEGWIEDDGGTITIGRGAADDDDCGDCSSGFLRERLVAIR
jgi:hypothetical protein